MLTDYVEMRGKSEGLNKFMQEKHLGSKTEIPTGWSKFFKFIKNSYLKLKKSLASK